MLFPFIFMAKGLLLSGSGAPLDCPVRPGFKEVVAGWDLGRRGGPGTYQALYLRPCFELNPSRLPGSRSVSGCTYTHSPQRPPHVG